MHAHGGTVRCPFGLTRAVIRHLREPPHDKLPARYPAPPELVLHRHLGESRFLVAGGLLDQPPEWFRVQHAGYVASFIDDLKTRDAQKRPYSPDEQKLMDLIAEVDREFSRGR